MKSIKKQFKESPFSVLINPLLWPAVFLIVLYAFWSRLKYSSEMVFFSVEPLKKINSFLKDAGTNNFTLINCTLDDLNLIIDVRTYNKAESNIEYFYKNRLKNGDSCFVLMHDGVPVSYLWTSIKKVTIEATGFSIDLPAKCFAIYDVFTAPVHRSKGFYTVLLKQVIEHYQNLNFQEVCLWVMKHNQSAVRVQKNVGFTEITKEIGYFALLGFKKRIIREVNYPITNLIFENQ